MGAILKWHWRKSRGSVEKFHGAFWNDVVDKILDKLGIKGAYEGKLPEGVRVHKRESVEAEYLFVQNYQDNPVEIKLTEDMLDMEIKEVVGNVKLSAYDVKVLKR